MSAVGLCGTGNHILPSLTPSSCTFPLLPVSSSLPIFFVIHPSFLPIRKTLSIFKHPFFSPSRKSLTCLRLRCSKIRLSGNQTMKCDMCQHEWEIVTPLSFFFSWVEKGLICPPYCGHHSINRICVFRITTEWFFFNWMVKRRFAPNPRISLAGTRCSVIPP